MQVDRRTLILKAATQSFAQFGYKSTTMDLVSKIANVGKGTIYTFFSTKDELFEDILSSSLEEMQSALNRSIKQGETFLDNLMRVLDAMLEFRSDHDLFIKLAQEVRDIGTTQAIDSIRKLENLVLESLKQEINRAIHNGQVTACDPDIAAFIIMRLYIALTTDWNKLNVPLNKDQIKTNMQLFIAKGILLK
jgi:TetR/AcrR family transcriptional regulator of autoinduction and epiphytic fitness